MVLLRTTEKSGSCFIRTDQLDGETDWKLRLAIAETQKLVNESDLFLMEASVFAEKPQRDIHTFIGSFKKVFNTLKQFHTITVAIYCIIHQYSFQFDDPPVEDSLNIENTLWANTVCVYFSHKYALLFF